MTKADSPSALTRRHILAAGAAAAGAAALEVTPALAAQAAAGGVDWSPRLLSDGQAALLSRLCDIILPRTGTPGALDAGVPAWIDLEISLAEGSEQLAFLGGLGWVDQRAQEAHGDSFLALREAEQVTLLEEISDAHEPAGDLRAGAEFFSDLKRRTLFAFFTSREGRVDVLGRPAKVERQEFHGCDHGGHREA